MSSPRTTRESDSTWISAHVFFHGNLDLLVTSVLATLVEELAMSGVATEFFFLRYWDGGPHLRFRVLPAESGLRAEAERMICDRFEQYLGRSPASDCLSPENYARLAPMLAEREGMRSYTERLYPNNTIALIPYQREHERYGHGSAMRTVEQHFTESSRIALSVLTRGASLAQRTTAALACILLTWFIAYPATGRPDRTVEAEAVPLPRAAVNRAIDLARRMQALAGPAGRSAPGPLTTEATLVDWARSVAALRHALDRADNTAMVLDLCAHLFCNRLGVSVGAEAAVRQLAAASVRALKGDSPQWTP